MNQMIRLRGVALAVLIGAFGSCALNPDGGGTGGADSGATGTGGSGGSVGSSSGVARGLSLANLTSDQASTLCDWTNLKQGGYGRIVGCPGGGVEATNPSNQSCVNSTLALGNRCLQLTVGNIEDCANVTGTDLCKFESANECVVVATCGQ